MSDYFKVWTAVFAAIIVGACTDMNSVQVAPSLEERIATIEEAKIQEDAYFASLAADVKAGSRDEVWAKRQESMLRESFAAADNIPPGALKNVECRSSKCQLQLQLPLNQPAKAAIEQQIAVGQWITWSQPCSYAMGMGPEPAAGAIRIFLDCGERVATGNDV